jgi:hypothetical protein
LSFLKAVLPIKANIMLQIDEKAWLGQKMKGVTTLEPQEVFTVEEMRLELRVYERYTVRVPRRDSKGRTKWVNESQKDTVYSQDQAISGAFITTVGMSREFPFETVFPNASPRHRGSLTYSLKAVASVKGRADVTEELSRPKSELILSCVPGTDFKEPSRVDGKVMAGNRRCLDCKNVFPGTVSTPCPSCGSTRSSPVVE